MQDLSILEKIGFAFRGVAIFGVAFCSLVGLLMLFNLGMSLRGVFFAALILIPVFAFIGMGILLAKVIIDRLSNEEDDYYSKNVER
ncbi:hypothetical protein [Ponticaulis profundi]|uniref:Uncharacterized protein n=1 Tax=Ponticaulis profundi TaxID=2665222 RepID=A0ABW1SET1_9PROT